MATARIPVSWIVCAAVLAFFVFFGYHILQAMNTKEGFDHSQVAATTIQAAPASTIAQAADQLQMAGKNQLKGPQGNTPLRNPNQPVDVPVEFYKYYTGDNPPSPHASLGLSQLNEPLLETTEQPAPALDRLQKPAVPKPWPTIPAMTEAELRTPEPLQRTPPPVLYDDPEPTDPLNRLEFMDAEFGSNLRHPEQMIEHRVQPPSIQRIVPSGVGSEVSSPGLNNADGYSPEMIQNGGQFMPNVLAWDKSTLNSAYSMI
jgi:hypothetical protein